MCLLVWGWLGLFNVQTGSILYRSYMYNKISPRQSSLTNPGKQTSHESVNIILKLTNSVMYISLMGKILNSPKGVKSGVLERVIIFAAHVAPVTSLCTQADDPITNDRCIHRACSYSRGHLPGNGMVRYTLFKSTGYNLIIYVHMYVLEMSTNCDGYPHHMIISCTSYTFTNDCDRIIS